MKCTILHSPIGSAATADEQDTLVQAQAVEQALSALGWQTARLSFDAVRVDRARAELASSPPDVVFNLVEEVEDKHYLNWLAPVLLEAWGLKHTGCPSLACCETTNKLAAKRQMVGAAIKTPPWLSLNPADDRTAEHDRHYIIKPVSTDASKGIIESEVKLLPGSEVPQRLTLLGEESASQYFGEAFIEGREFNLSVLEINGKPAALPPAEITFDDFPPGKLRIVGYQAKWVEDSFEYQNTPRSFAAAKEQSALSGRLRETALRCWHLFGLRGYARVDFRVDKEEQCWVLEINANPCIAPESGFMAAAAQAGLSYTEAIEHIVKAALR